MNILVAVSNKKMNNAINNNNNNNNINKIIHELKNRTHNIVCITETQTTNTSKSILLKLWNYLYLIYIIKKNKIQLLHNIYYANNFICDFASKITNTPIVNTCCMDNNTSKELFSINNIIKPNNIFKTVDILENTYQHVYITKKRKEIPVILYHRFIKNKNEIGKARNYLHIKRLEKHFKFLKKRGYETLTFADLLNKGLIYRLAYGKKFIIITVDDGYEDNYYFLFPLLKKYNFKAIIYMVTGTSYNQWDVDKLKEPKIPLMKPQQLVEMVNSGLVEIGGHTFTHPDLTQLTNEQQYQEIHKNKLQLEAILKQTIISFAYPYGHFNQYSKNVLRELGYNFAVAVEENVSNIFLHQDLYEIKRICICPWDITIFLWFKTTGYFWHTEKFYKITIKLLVLIKKSLFIIPSFLLKKLKLYS